MDWTLDLGQDLDQDLDLDTGPDLEPDNSIEFSDFTDTRFEKKIIQKCVLNPSLFSFCQKMILKKKFELGLTSPPLFGQCL